MAAAERWDADWERLDTQGGFVVNGPQRIGFGELAEKAATLELPEHLPVRGGLENRLAGRPLPRLDLPSKVDGSARFAGDVRLPAIDRKSVVEGKRVSVRVDLGVRRLIKKNTNIPQTDEKL